MTVQESRRCRIITPRWRKSGRIQRKNWQRKLLLLNGMLGSLFLSSKGKKTANVCPFVYFTFDFDPALVLFHDAVNGGKTSPAPFPTSWW